MRADQAAPLVFAAWADELTRGILGGKLGEATFRPLYGKRHFRGTLEDILEHQDTAWCGAAGCDAQSAAALARALDRLQGAYGDDVGKWAWGRAHETQWDLAIVDLFLKQGSGLRILEACRKRSPSQKVVVFSNYATREMRMAVVPARTAISRASRARRRTSSTVKRRLASPVTRMGKEAPPPWWTSSLHSLRR